MNVQAPEVFSEVLDRARKLKPVLASRARAAEALRRIPDETIADLHASGLFRILQPRRVGGLELPYDAIVRVTAILAQGCGSTAWVTANLANHDFMLALWPREAQDEVWLGDARALIGSALMFPPGHATKVPGGYKLTGRWKFSSGIDACTWTMVGGIASADGELPDYRVFLLPAADYSIIDTWRAAGLRGTGSNDVEVADVFVPEHRALSVALMKGCAAPGAAVNPGPLYRLPVFDMFPYVVAATALGIAQGAVEQFAEDTRHRVTSYSTTLLADHATTQARLGEAAAAADAAEVILISSCERAMAAAETSRVPSAEEKIRLRRDGAYAARLCTRAVDLLFEAGGGEFLYEDKPMQRAFRDVHAAQGHYALAWDVAALTAGKCMLGIAPDLPTL
ncbi:MAG TPA: acyl-CoA dehydrogenase family protein [Burkholderiales bacterium]|nr:acyl-CoA dehydrogenase family protein [Burkholderiales bacterium]